MKPHPEEPPATEGTMAFGTRRVGDGAQAGAAGSGTGDSAPAGSGSAGSGADRLAAIFGTVADREPEDPVSFDSDGRLAALFAGARDAAPAEPASTWWDEIVERAPVAGASAVAATPSVEAAPAAAVPSDGVPAEAVPAEAVPAEAVPEVAAPLPAAPVPAVAAPLGAPTDDPPPVAAGPVVADAASAESPVDDWEVLLGRDPWAEGETPPENWADTALLGDHELDEVAAPLAAASGIPPAPADVMAPPATRPRGLRGALFGTRARTFVSTAVAVLAIAVIALGAFVGVRTFLDASELEQASAELQSAEGAAETADSLVAASVARLDESAAAALGAIDGTGPALDAVDGLIDAALLAAARAALAELQATVDDEPPGIPDPYETASLDDVSAVEVREATEDADEHAARVQLAIADLDSSADALDRGTSALHDALRAIGASLGPLAAALLLENDLAEVEFRDAVTAAATAVVDVQSDGWNGSRELVAFAAAVTALRENQALMEEEEAGTPVRPRTNTGTGGGTTTPTEPAPAPAPQPEPSPTETTPPAPEPEPSP